MTERKVYKLKKADKPFICNKCNKGFVEDRYLQQHLKRKTPCNKEHICSKCNKVFESGKLLLRHLNRKTPCALEEIPVITNDNIENKCRMCGKEFSTASNLKRHQKDVCNASNTKVIKQLMDRITQLESQISGTPQTVINGDVNIQNNIQNTYVNVTICSFGDEDLSKLDKNKVMHFIKNNEKDFMPKMIEHVHANPDMPEHHNVFYDPVRNKAIVYASISESEKSWQAHDFEEVLKQITKKIKTYMKPGHSPYFDMAMKDKDYDTSNIIIRIADQTDWNTDEVFERAKTCLGQMSKNKDLMNIVTIED